MNPCKYRVKNWRQFQHYKDRDPPWIKLHFSTLSSSDWVMLSDASRVLAIACMLIASRHEGGIPDDPDYIQRVAYLSKRPDFKPLIECGFLEMLADASDCKQMQANACPEERRDRDRGETDTRASALDAFEEFWKVVPKKVAKGQAERAFKAALKACQAQTLIASMKTYAESVSGTESRFIAHPATWLNGKRWLDNQAPKSGNGSASSVDHRKKLEAMAFKIKRRMGQEYSAAYHRADLEECVKLGLITEDEMLEI